MITDSRNDYKNNKNQFYSELRPLLGRMRLNSGISQVTLSKMIGCDRNHIQRIESKNTTEIGAYEFLIYCMIGDLPMYDFGLGNYLSPLLKKEFSRQNASSTQFSSDMRTLTQTLQIILQNLQSL